MTDDKDMPMKSHPLKPNVLLIQARLETGLSQPELARRLHVSLKQVWRWENGRAQPRHYYRLLLCDVFQKTVEELGLDTERISPPSPEIGRASCRERV